MATKNQEEDDVKKVQIKAYVDWMNAQLKKKPGTRLIEDLKCDVQDGVALSILISVIAGQELDGIYPVPATAAEQIHNISLVITFMMEKKIKMHPLSAKDIVDGNIKAIMRLILALAAHYKPNSVKQSSRGSPSSSMAGLAQSAAVALAGVRRDVASAGHRPQRPAQLHRPPRSFLAWDNSQSLDGTTCSSGNSSAVINLSSPQTSHYQKTMSPGHQPFTGSLNKTRSSPHKSDKLFNNGEQETISRIVNEGALISVLDDEHQLLADDVQAAYKLLCHLQQLLIHGSGPEEVTSEAVESEANSSQQPLMLKILLQNSEKTNEELRKELSQVRSECLQLQGIKTGLVNRLAELEESFLVLKAELLRAGFCQQSLETTKVELEQKLAERDAMILELQQGLSRKDQQLEEVTVERHVQQHDRDSTSRNIKSQILVLHDKLNHVSQTEVSLSSRMVNQDHKLKSLENKILNQGQGIHDKPSKSHHNTNQSYDRDDLHLVRESLHNLRQQFPGGDPQHETIDTLELSISSLLNRLSSCRPDSQLTNSGNNLSWTGSTGKGDSNSVKPDQHEGEGLQYLIVLLALELVSGSALQKLGNRSYFSDDEGNVLVPEHYPVLFTTRPLIFLLSSTGAWAYVHNIKQQYQTERLGEIRLKDIKSLLDRPGNYRYHFKALDPEFGTVKEEIMQDEDVIPGWEGKVVAWIEEDHE